MPDLLEQIKEVKTKAKNRRDLKRYDAASSFARHGIDLASKEYEATGVPEWRATLASELADCWGILGGIERRWALDTTSDPAQRVAHLRQSVVAYDRGHRYEPDTSTYNRLNRLLVRLLLNPERLVANGGAADQEQGETLNVRAELEAVAAQIEAQGTDSVWAAADLALLNVLLGRQDAASAYAALEKKEPPDFACQSALEGLSPLASAELPTADELKKAEKRLIALRDRQLTR